MIKFSFKQLFHWICALAIGGLILYTTIIWLQRQYYEAQFYKAASERLGEQK